MTAADVRVDEVVVFVQRFVCLGDGELILLVRSEVVDHVGHGGHAVFILYHPAIGRHDEAVFVDL